MMLMSMKGRRLPPCASLLLVLKLASAWSTSGSVQRQNHHDAFVYNGMVERRTAVVSSSSLAMAKWQPPDVSVINDGNGEDKSNDWKADDEWYKNDGDDKKKGSSSSAIPGPSWMQRNVEFAGPESQAAPRKFRGPQGGGKEENLDRDEGRRGLFSRNGRQGDRPSFGGGRQGDRPYSRDGRQGDRPYGRQGGGDTPYGRQGDRPRGDRPFPRDGRQGERPSTANSRSFRQDFQGSRVFVQNIPLDASWQDLKDHFKVAGEVVFASVSQDRETGESKGHGIIQFETTEMALTAVAIMRDHPLNGQVLFVREDVKEGKEGATLKNTEYVPRDRFERPPEPAWLCADEENAEFLSDSDRTEVLSLIKARDDARRRRKYDVSDTIREELKLKFNIHIDDRLKQWWTSMDGKNVPQSIRDAKGEGRWGAKRQEEWRQIPTTPESDACVNPDLVEGLLKQRDIARREKDWKTADMLLEQAKNAPDGDLYLRIHDESRTWRVWTDAKPPREVAPHLGPAEQCLAIVREHAPEKIEEVELLLSKFPGREFNILKKLKQRYVNVTPSAETSSEESTVDASPEESI